MVSQTYIFPRSHALAVFERHDRLTVIDPASGWVSTVTGALVSDARALLDDGIAAPRLEAMASSHLGIALLVRLASEERLAGSLTSAIRLEQFGTLFMELVGQCNERCTHCYAGSGPEIDKALPKDRCLQIVTDAAALGFSRIQFTGGDPLLCKFLPDLVAHAKTCGVPYREVYTNGLALSSALLDALEPSDPMFAFSMYSADAEIHDSVTNTPGSHRRTTDAIVRTLARGLELRVGIIAMENNAEGVQDTVSFLNDLGVTSIAVSPTFEVGRGTHYVSETPVASGNSHGGSMSAAVTEGKLCVTYDGDVVPCIFNREMSLGSIYQRRLIDIAETPTKPKRGVVGREEFLESCRTGLQCSTCKLTACALHFGRN